MLPSNEPNTVHLKTIDTLAIPPLSFVLPRPDELSFYELPRSLVSVSLAYRVEKLFQQNKLAFFPKPYGGAKNFLLFYLS